jgi:GNAT superfamily N-acetyltransferase
MQTEEITYQFNPTVSVEEFRSLLLDSGLAARRPVDEPDRLAAMLANANVIVTARLNDELVGIARSVSDLAFCCYLSDLAVSKHAQGRGIGAKLIEETRRQVGPSVSVILSAVPEAVEFYQRIGMPALPDCFWHRRER